MIVPPIKIPCKPCPWQDRIYLGKEVELVPVGVRELPRSPLARDFVRRLAKQIPSVPRTPEPQPAEDRCTSLGRFYQEMGDFVEVAGPTCRSPEAVAWCYEAALEALSQVTMTVKGQQVILCHTPSDYSDQAFDGGPPHSTGVHFNVLSPRMLELNEIETFADIVSPLNAVFGCGGLTWSGGDLRFSCDPRSDHVKRLVGGAVHGSSPKTFLLLRDEPFARPPHQRLQVVAFGGPRSPVSSWLQAELIPMSLRAVLAGRKPPWRMVDPINTLRAGPDDLVRLASTTPGGSKSIVKAQLAVETVQWLAEATEELAVGRECAHRVAHVRDLSIQAVTAGAMQAAEPPVFPTDLAVKRILFDRVARMHGFKDLSELGRASTSRGTVRRAIDTLIVTDIAFSTPNRQQSTYELANRFGLFIRPEFDHPIDLQNLTLPEGVSSRDRARASLLADGRIRFCDWHEFDMDDGSRMSMPDPWSEPKRDQVVCRPQ